MIFSVKLKNLIIYVCTVVTLKFDDDFPAFNFRGRDITTLRILVSTASAPGQKQKHRNQFKSRGFKNA